MKEKITIYARVAYYSIFLLSVIAVFLATKQLFFFDEDIFVVNSSNSFMSGSWQRSITCQWSFRLDNYIWGADPAGYHITNITLHFIDALLATAVLKRLLRYCAAWLSLWQINFIPVIFIAFFLISPIHAEPLCYILARDAVLVTFFCLCSILFLLRSGLKNKWLIGLSIVCFILGLLSYEISWLVPVMILGITIFFNRLGVLTIRKAAWLSGLYFFVFVAWFIIKIGLVDHFVVSDYKNESLFKTEWAILFKNIAVLLARNFVPPFQRTLFFISASAVAGLLLLIGFVKLYKKQSRLFLFSILLLALTVCAYLPAALIGIDSHDSESERYIYFSSCFGIMLLAVLLGVCVKNVRVLFVMFCTVITFNAAILFTTIGYYNKAAQFSQVFLAALNVHTGNNEQVLIIDQPAQYHGALLYRAKSRMNNNSANSITVLNEFMQDIYQKKNTQFVSLSAKEITGIPSKLTVTQLSLDSLKTFFPYININAHQKIISTDKQEQLPLQQKQIVVAALKDTVLYLFK